MQKQQLMILICLLFVIPHVIRADLGLPSIQAVCEARLKDGTTVEGVVLVATGGYLKQFDTNGFLLIVETQKDEGSMQPKTIEKGVLFSLSFHAIQPYKGIVERLPSSRSGWGNWFHDPNVYFLCDVTYSHHFTYNLEVRSEFDTTGSSLLLMRDLIDHRVYKLLDYVPIYSRVPEELYLSREIKSVKQLKIKVENIQRFKLVFEPSQMWLDEIAAAEKAFKESHDMFEVLLPVWWHDIMKQQDHYKNSFKKWSFY